MGREKNQTADDDAYVEEELGGNLGGEGPDAVVGGAIEAVGMEVPGLGEVVEEVPEGGGHRPPPTRYRHSSGDPDRDGGSRESRTGLQSIDPSWGPSL